MKIRSTISKISTYLLFASALFFSNKLSSQNVAVSGALSGNGSYPNLAAAFTAINGGAQTSANISVQILASTTETVSAVLNAGAWTSLTISPSGGSYTVSGTIAGPLVDLNGADNVSILGQNALVFSNLDNGTANTSTIRFINDATLNTITQCSVLGSSNATGLGTITFSTATSVGNNSNTVSSCNIGQAGTNYPVNALYSVGTLSFENKNNNILNCNVYNFFSPALATTGLNISSNNTNWLISGNKLYLTSAFTYTTANTHKAILVTSGNNYTVTGNTIGYSSAASTGTMTMGGTIATRFVGIELSVGTLTASSVQNNTIAAITLSTSSGATTTYGIICGINITGGNVSVNNNLIGATTGVGSISGYPTTTGGLVVGINSTSTGTINIQGNFVGACLSTGNTAAVAGNFNGINISGLATGLSITSNTIGNGTTDNCRAGTSTLTTGNSFAVGIHMPSAVTFTNVVVSNNFIQNISSYGTGTGCFIRGIATASSSATGIYSIANNTITNLTTNSSNVAVTTGQVGAVGILLATGTTCTVSGNYISNIANTGTSTLHVVVAGLSNANGTNTVFRFNRVWGLSNTSPGTTITGPPVACGFFIRSGTSGLLIHNNMISLGNGQSSNTSFMGVYGNHGSSPNPTVQVYHNTINIEGTVSSGSLPTFGIARTDFGATARVVTYDIKNNLVTNTRSGGSGAHYAIANNYGVAAPSTSGWAAGASNYNVLNANAGTVGWWGANQTLASWQATASCDGSSYSGIAVTYSNSVSDLHLNMGTTPNYLESGGTGTAVTGINIDIDNQTRPGPVGSVNGGGIFPDIGADEFDGVFIDIVAPIISYTPLGIACNSGNRTFSVSFTDLSGVPTTGSLVPRVYYKKNSGSYFSSPGVLASGSATSGVWNFTINSTTMGGLSSGDNVSYFVIAQDIASTVNIGAIPASGLLASNVLTVSSTPTAPYTYSVIIGVSPTVTPSSFSLCVGNSQTLTATGPNFTGTMSVGTNVQQNSATTFPAPYSRYYGGQRYQFIVQASELSTAGFGANSTITSIAFPVASFGANWGVSAFDIQNYIISVGATTLTSLSAFQTGLTQVFGPVNYSPTVGYNNIHAFSTPFVWNGTDNLVIETAFSNSVSGTSADAVIQYTTGASAGSSIIYRADNVSAATIYTTTTISLTYASRVDFKLFGTTSGVFSWSPSNDLSSSSGTLVTSTPTVSKTYTLSLYNGVCTTTSSAVANVVIGPTLSLAGTGTICSGNVATLSVSGASSYSWSTGSTSANISTTPSVTTTYSVTGTTSGCTSTALTTVSVNPSPIVNIAGTSALCTGQSASLIASGASSYSWNTGATTNSITTSPTITTTYSVTGTDPNGCSSTTAQLVSVAASLSVTITGPSSICVGQTATLTGNGGATYTWNTGATSSSLALTPSVTTTYSIIGSSGTCSNTNVKTVTVNPTPTVSVSGSLSLCAGQTVTLTASGANTYSWSNGATNATAALSPTLPTSYTITGTNTLGCSNATNIIVMANPLPNIGITQSAGTVCVNTPITFTASGANTYTWSNAANTNTTSFTPTASSVYTVNATSLAGCVNSKTVSVGTFALPVFVISPASPSVCLSNTITLFASGANTYTWNNTIFSNSAAFSPTANTVYTLSGTSINNCVSSTTVGVATFSLPVVAISPSVQTVCVLSPVSFTASGASTYTWNNSTTLLSSTVSLIPSASAIYSVTGTDSFGCTGSATVSVTGLPLPNISITPSLTTVCALSPVNFTASGAQTYSWSTGASGSMAAVSPSALATYSVVGTDSNNCTSSAQAVILTNTLPVIGLSPVNATVCSLSPVSFTASGAVSYTWSGGSNGSTVTLAPASNTVYTVSGTDLNNGCVGTTTFAVNTNSLPVIAIAASAASVCPGSTATFTASGANSFTWTVVNSTGSVVSITPSANAVYTVSGTDNFGCVGTKTVSLDLFNLPTISVTPQTSTICLNEVATFSVAGANTFTWQPGAGTGTTFTASPIVLSQYTVTGTDGNNCDNSAVVTLFVNSCTGLSETADNNALIRLFPNPTNGVITAKFDYEGVKEILIIDETGKAIEIRTTEQRSEVFDLTKYAKGIYLVRVQSKSATGYFRISVQ